MKKLWTRIKPLFDAKLWKFLLVGVVNTLVGSALIFGFYNLLGMGYWLSSALGYVLASVISFFLNKYFTFKSGPGGPLQILKFAVNIAICYLLAYGIAQPLVTWLAQGASETLRDNLALLTGMVFFTGFNYLGQRLFVFRSPKQPPPRAEADTPQTPAPPQDPR